MNKRILILKQTCPYFFRFSGSFFETLMMQCFHFQAAEGLQFNTHHTDQCQMKKIIYLLFLYLREKGVHNKG